MPDYRAYILDHDGHIKSFEPIVCDDDDRAIAAAKQLVDGQDVELWQGKRMVTKLAYKLFDPIAAATDWLDAYRSSDIETILKMYSDDAVIECGCGGMKTITGKEGLRAYWEERLEDYPVMGLDGLQPSSDGATISYLSRDGVVRATLEFGASSRISSQRCASSSCPTNSPVALAR